MSLKEIFCQDKAISILQRALSADKVAHAYIFAGIEGIGKFKTAREWAKLLLCKSPVVQKTRLGEFADSCGSCRSCRLLEAGAHPDFHLVYKELLEFTKDNKGKKTPVELPIDVVREFLIDKVSIKPILSRRKVFVVTESEKLNTSSQNALLKVLEEPPEYCSIILLCTRLERLLPTTRSRCQAIRFAPVAEEKVVEKLKEMGLDDQKSRYFARLGQGSLGRCVQWAQLELEGADIYQTKKGIINSLSSYKYANALNLAERFLKQSKRIAELWAELDKKTSKRDINRRTQKTLIWIIISALHDVMKLDVTGIKGIINFDQGEQIQALARRFDCEQAAEEIAHAYRALRSIDSNVNERLIFEQLLLHFADSDIIRV